MSIATDNMWTSTTNLDDSSLFTNDPAFGRPTGSGIYTSYSAGNLLLLLLLDLVACPSSCLTTASSEREGEGGASRGGVAREPGLSPAVRRDLPAGTPEPTSRWATPNVSRCCTSLSTLTRAGVTEEDWLAIIRKVNEFWGACRWSCRVSGAETLTL